MPTSSQSKILSTVDHQIQQQTSSSTDITRRPSLQLRSTRLGKGNKDDDDDEQSARPVVSPNTAVRRRSSLKLIEVSNLAQSSQHNENSFSDDESNGENEEMSRLEQRRASLTESSRRLLLLGTIRPSKTFYRDLPDGDVEYLMEYFRRMRISQKPVNSEEINEELTKKFVEYKPKLFFDSSRVTKKQVNQLEKLFEDHRQTIEQGRAELCRLEQPTRFVVKQIDNQRVVLELPRDYNDCLCTLINQSDPLRKSELVRQLASNKLLDDLKDNSMDISYFPGGVNFDLPREEINEQGIMDMDTYHKLKKRVAHQKVRYFSDPPEKRTNAFVVFMADDFSLSVDSQSLINLLHEHLASTKNDNIGQSDGSIVSIEFVPMTCLLNSFDVSNYFVVDCRDKETKQQFIDRPLKINIRKQTIQFQVESYDEFITKEYDKFIKSERYKELLRTHDDSTKKIHGKK